MSIVVEFGIPAERFELGSYVARHDGLEAELERVVPAGERAIPYVWITGRRAVLDELTRGLERSEAVASVTLLDELEVDDPDECQRLYRVRWDPVGLEVIEGVFEAEGAILEGRSMEGYWLFRFRFPDHDHVAQFYQHLTDHDVTGFRIERIYELTARSGRDERSDLTPEQREAAVLAARRGYFSTPREVTLEELGEELGISEQAVSQRLRRATETIILSALNVPGTSPSG